MLLVSLLNNWKEKKSYRGPRGLGGFSRGQLLLEGLQLSLVLVGVGACTLVFLVQIEVFLLRQNKYVKAFGTKVNIQPGGPKKKRNSAPKLDTRLSLKLIFDFWQALRFSISKLPPNPMHKNSKQQMLTLTPPPSRDQFFRETCHFRRQQSLQWVASPIYCE